MNNLISNLPGFPNLDSLKSASTSGPSDADGNFGSVLKTAINQVEELHGSADSKSPIC